MLKEIIIYVESRLFQYSMGLFLRISNIKGYFFEIHWIEQWSPYSITFSLNAKLSGFFLNAAAQAAELSNIKLTIHEWTLIRDEAQFSMNTWQPVWQLGVFVAMLFEYKQFIAHQVATVAYLNPIQIQILHGPSQLTKASSV